VDVDSGKPYYFHRASREVSWSRPVKQRSMLPPAPAREGESGGSSSSSGLSKKDDDYNSVEFQDALYLVAREQAAKQTGGGDGQRVDEVAHEIAGKLRRRFVKHAEEQQQQSESYKRDVEMKRGQQQFQQQQYQQQHDQRAAYLDQQRLLDRQRAAEEEQRQAAAQQAWMNAQRQAAQTAAEQKEERENYDDYLDRQRKKGHETRLGNVTDGEYEERKLQQKEREDYVRSMELEGY